MDEIQAKIKRMSTIDTGWVRGILNDVTPATARQANVDVDLRQSKCAQCGKVFHRYSSTKWAYKMVYKYQLKYFCTWSCMRSYQATHQTRGKRKGGLV